MTVAMLEAVHGEAEEERLRAVADLGISGTGREERFDRITRLAQQLFGVERAAITLIDRDVQWFKSEQGWDGTQQVPRAGSFCNTTIAQPGLTVAEDTRRDLRFARSPYVTGEPHIRFYAGHPLVSATGHAVGTLCLFDARPRAFSPLDRKMLTELGEWAETELNHSQEMERAAEVQRALVPRPGAVEVPGYRIEGTCLPARSVGGDLVDWFLAPGDDVVVTLGDVMGKGIGAALVAAAVRSTLRTSARLFGPAAAIRETALALDEDLQSTSTLVTLCLGRLTPATGELRWSDAGHGLLMLVRADGRVLRPKHGGLPLGTVTDGDWPERTIYLERGDIAVAFSDGLLDLFPSVDATVAAVAAGIREDPDTAVDRLRAMAGSTRLADDVAGVMIRRCA
jgi:hypothetical protein